MVGFLITAIKENYTNISKHGKWEFSEKQDYGNLDELENLLLANSVQMNLTDIIEQG